MRKEYLLLLATLTAASCGNGEEDRINTAVAQTLEKERAALTLEPSKTLIPTIRPLPTASGTPPPPTKKPTLEPTISPTPTTQVEQTHVIGADIENERKLEQALGGDVVTLEKPHITSIWQLPWASEKDEPGVAVFALLWGQDDPAGVITSADCVREYYEGEGELTDPVFSPPLTSFRVWKLQGDVRPESLDVEVSEHSHQANATRIDTIGPEGEVITESCEETSELERFERFLGNVDWNELPGEAGELTGELVGDFARGLLRGLKED